MAKTRRSKLTVQDLKLTNVVPVEFFIKAPTTSLMKENTDFKFSFHIEAKVKEKENSVIIISTVNVFIEKPEETYCKLVVHTQWEIPRLTDYFIKESGKLDITQDISDILNRESIATARGIFYERVRGTFLHNTLIPLIHKDNLKPKEQVETKMTGKQKAKP